MFLPAVKALKDDDALAHLGRAKVKRIIFMVSILGVHELEYGTDPVPYFSDMSRLTATSITPQTKSAANGPLWTKPWLIFAQDPKAMRPCKFDLALWCKCNLT